MKNVPDFNFEKGTVKLYSSRAYDITSNKLLYLLYMIILGAVVSFILGYVLRRYLPKKKQKDIQKGEELLEL